MEIDPFKNGLISPPTELIDGVVLRLIKEESSPRAQMVLVIDEYTNFDMINKNRRRIKGAYYKLNEAQGSDIQSQGMGDLNGLMLWHKEGVSWKNMTLRLNYVVHSMTLMAYAEMQKVGKQTVQPEGLQKVVSDSDSIIRTPDEAMLLSIFFSLGKDIQDFSAWMKQGIESFANNQFPFRVTSEPFEEKRIRDKVRYFQKVMASGKTTISEGDLQFNLLEFQIYLLHQKGYLAKLNELLDKEGLKDWVRNKGLLQRQVNMIIKKWEESEDQRVILFRDLIKNSGKN